MKYIDTHAHLNFESYDLDRSTLISEIKDNNITVINVGTHQQSSRFAVELADQHDHLYAIVGLHPVYVAPANEPQEKESHLCLESEKFDIDFYSRLAQSSPRVVGIGECGLDYFRNSIDTKDQQKVVFRQQIELALELDLPLMLHVRPSADSMDAYHDVLDILREYKGRGNLRGQAHFFAGTVDIAEKFIELGFYISFTGVITFARMYEKIVAAIPLDKILSETDAPYVSPHPYRGQRNKPSHVREVLAKIARIKKIDESEMAEQVMNNAKNLYRLV